MPPVFAAPPVTAGRASVRVARLLVFVAVAVGTFVVSLGPIADGDIYWHLAAGRAIVRQAALLRTDAFTVSAAGRPWIDVHWLFQLGAFALYSVFGFAGLAIAKAGLLAGGAAILVWVAERAGTAARSFCAIAVLGGLVLDRHLVPLRPVLFTLVFLGLFLLVLERIRVGQARWWWPALPLVQVVWCNCQGLAPLGPLLVAAYLAGASLSSRGLGRWPFLPELPSSVRPLAILLVACLLAGFATPYGFDGVALPARLLVRIMPGQANVFSTAIAENIPPFILERSAPELVWHLKWALLATAVLVGLLRPRFHLAHLLVLAALLVLALMANRNLPLLYWVAPPLFAVTLAPGLASLADRLRRLSKVPLSTALVLAMLGGENALAVAVRQHEPIAGSPTPFHFPVESARRLAELHLSGPGFAADQHGGYLGFMVPDLRPYIDTRLVLHTGQEYADYLALFDQPARFDALAAGVGFVAVVLTTANPDRHLGLIWHLYHSPDWRLVYTDGYEILFLRQGMSLDLHERATIEAILRDQRQRYGSDRELAAAARLHLARLLVVLGQPHQAEYVLSPLASRSAAQLRARAAFAAGEHAAAETLASILLAQDPRDLRSLVLLAEIAAARGQTERAGGFLRQALAVNPYDAEAGSLVERFGLSKQAN